MTDNTPLNFNLDTQEDASQWIMTLYETLELMLDGDLQNKFTDLFKSESTITFICDHPDQHESEKKGIQYNPSTISSG